MRTLRYRLLPPVGPGTYPKTGTLIDLVRDIPYLFLFNVIPPLPALNEVLMKGVMDAGMSGGCKWKPFSIDAAEYGELVNELLSLGQYEVVEAPPSLMTNRTWRDWIVEQRRPRREITEADLSEGEKRVYGILTAVYAGAIQSVTLIRQGGVVTAELQLDPWKVRCWSIGHVLTNIARWDEEGRYSAEETFRRNLRDPS